MVTVAIQAGGGSTRMGQDKALLRLGGKPLIERVISRVGGLGDEILITTNRPEDLAYLGLRMASDRNPGGGALEGLRTAVSAARHDCVLVVACDMPFLSKPLLGHLLSKASEAQVIIPRAGKRCEPFHAVYHRSCLPAIEAALALEERSIVSFFRWVKVGFVAEEEIIPFDPQRLSFFNVNTPQELARAEALLTGGEQEAGARY